MTDELYEVHITLQEEGEPVRVTLALTEAFGALPVRLRAESLTADTRRGEVEVDFEQMEAQAPEARKSEVDRALAALARLGPEPESILPAIRALIGLAAAQRRAGLQEQPGRMTIEVEPQRTRTSRRQDEGDDF